MTKQAFIFPPTQYSTRTEHIRIDCHFIHEKIVSRDITTRFINSNDLLTYVFSKTLQDPRIDYICDKLSAYDLYARA